MDYFTNKPFPTPGPQLPMPGSNKIVPNNESRQGLKRKLQGEAGKQRSP